MTTGSFAITPTYSVNGIGDIQNAYVVAAGGKRILHSGDTLWDGYWWKMRQAFGPFDAVFLPVSAAVVLEARQLVPHHYGTFHTPPWYAQTPDVLSRLEASTRNKLKLTVMQAKDEISLA